MILFGNLKMGSLVLFICCGKGRMVMHSGWNNVEEEETMTITRTRNKD